MNLHSIPQTDLVVSAISLGSTGIGSTIDRDTSFRLLDMYAEQGGNFLDTAAVYANWLPGERNISEKTIGRWLQRSGKRDELVLATKGAHPELDTMHLSRMSRSDIESDLNTSLKNLQTDVIDLYWLHRDDPTRPVEEILEVMNDQVAAGKVRYFGCSNWRADRIRAAQSAADRAGIHGFVANQMRWSLAAIDTDAIPDQTTVTMDSQLFTFHVESGMAAVAYSSQAGGLFQKLANADDGAAGGVYPRTANQARLARIQQVAAATGMTISQIVLAYLQSQPFVTVPIVGCRTLTQLRDSLSAAGLTLTPAQVETLVATD